MQNMVINMCEKFHNDRLRNDRSLENGKSGNNKDKNNVRSAWSSGSKNSAPAAIYFDRMTTFRSTLFFSLNVRACRTAISNYNANV